MRIFDILTKSKFQQCRRPSWKVSIIIISALIIYLSYKPLTDWYNSHPSLNVADDPRALFIRSTLDPQERRLFLDTLRAFDTALKSANITYFVTSGTLLGTYRHHGIIPWDDDADVIIPWRMSIEAFRALEQYDPNRFSVYAGLGVSLSSLLLNGFGGKEFQLRFASKSFQWKFYPNDGKKVLMWPYRYPYVDIFFYEENSTHLSSTSLAFPDVYDKKLVFPLVSRPFDDFLVPTPCKIEEILTSLNMNASTCMSRTFSHKVDLPMMTSPINIPCSLLADQIPLVNRTIVSRWHNNTRESLVVKESLIRNGKVLKEYLITSLC